MTKYVCSICGYIYDEATGIPEAGIAPGTKWEDLPRNLHTKKDLTHKNLPNKRLPQAFYFFAFFSSCANKYLM